MTVAHPRGTRRGPWPPPGTGEPRPRRGDGAARSPGCSPSATGRRWGPTFAVATSRCSAPATAAGTAPKEPSATSSSPRRSSAGEAGRSGLRRRRPGRGTGPRVEVRPGVPSRWICSGRPERTPGPSASSSSTSGGRSTSRTRSRCSRTWGSGWRTSTRASSARTTRAVRCGSTTSGSGSARVRPPRTSTRPASRSRGASPGCGRARRRMTASTASPSFPASTGARSPCSGPTPSTSGRSASASASPTWRTP